MKNRVVGIALCLASLSWSIALEFSENSSVVPSLSAAQANPALLAEKNQAVSKFNMGLFAFYGVTSMNLEMTQFSLGGENNDTTTFSRSLEMPILLAPGIIVFQHGRTGVSVSGRYLNNNLKHSEADPESNRQLDMDISTGEWVQSYGFGAALHPRVSMGIGLNLAFSNGFTTLKMTELNTDSEENYEIESKGKTVSWRLGALVRLPNNWRIGATFIPEHTADTTKKSYSLEGSNRIIQASGKRKETIRNHFSVGVMHSREALSLATEFNYTEGKTASHSGIFNMEWANLRTEISPQLGLSALASYEWDSKLSLGLEGSWGGSSIKQTITGSSSGVMLQESETNMLQSLGSLVSYQVTNQVFLHGKIAYGYLQQQKKSTSNLGTTQRIQEQCIKAHMPIFGAGLRYEM